ncbi:MAG: hypothetical protein FWH55_07535 [Oscillospiraceae bacterium]|nr:hypothetical protein [Oscillospiraceae bacterium]
MSIIDTIIQDMDERYDTDSVRAALASIEELPYGLIHILLQEIARLGALLMSTREEVNLAAPPGSTPYLDLEENVWNRDYFDHPAVSRYEELHGPIKMIF